MPFIVSYRKHIDALVTRELLLPDGSPTHERLGVELATVDGVTYVALPDGAALPDGQPTEIAASIQAVTLTPDLREAIKAASPHARLIAQQVIDRIRALYSIDEELYLARVAVGALQGVYTPNPGEIALMTEYHQNVEGAREWGRAERARLGL